MSPLRESQQEKLDQHPLIVATKRQTGFQRYGFRLLTIMFWVLFLFLFRVAATPFAWLIGIQSVYEMFSYKVEAQDFADLMIVYVLVIIALGVCLIGWARYNQARFRENERRTKFRPPATVEESADFYQVSAELVRDSASARRMLFHHTDAGQLLDVEKTLPLSAPPLEPVPVEVGCYRYGEYLLQRDSGLRWSVYQAEQQIFYGGSFDSCMNYIAANAS